MEKSKVYFTSMKVNAGTNLLKKLNHLVREAGIANIDFENKYTAIKIHFGEPGNLAYLRPNYAKVIVDLVKELGGKPFLTDCNTLYVGRRKNALDHLDSAYENGYNPFATGCHVIIADGLKGTDEALVPVNGEYVKEAKIGRAVMDADIVISLTHFKGHTMGGFGGSNKNLGIGCADGRIGKGEIHTVPGSDNLWSIAEEELMERMTESTKATIDFFGDNIVYVNVMRNMSVSCDCEGTGAMPVVTPNVGILASTDICAIDVACVDLVYAMTEAELCDNRDLVERIETRHDLRQLSYMHELGMGNWKYRLLDLDNGEAEITQAEAVAHVTPFEG